MPPFGEACVCAPCSHRDSLELFFISRGTGADLPIQSNEAMAFRWMSGLINHLYLHNFLTYGKVLMQLQSRTTRRHPVGPLSP